MVKLKYFKRSDYVQLMKWIDSPEFLLQWSGSQFDYPLNEAQLERYIENANHDDAERLVYKVIDTESEEVIGHISLGKIDRKNKSARVGKVLVGNQGGRSKGIGQQMIKEILKVAFDELHLHRVTLGVFDFNAPAIRCYEKAGFVKEGLHRDTNKIGDEYWSLWEMSILENEWLRGKEVKSN